MLHPISHQYVQAQDLIASACPAIVEADAQCSEQQLPQYDLSQALGQNRYLLCESHASSHLRIVLRKSARAGYQQGNSHEIHDLE